MSNENGNDEAQEETRSESPPGNKGEWVPRSRLNEVLDKNKTELEAYEVEIAKLKDQLEQTDAQRIEETGTKEEKLALLEKRLAKYEAREKLAKTAESFSADVIDDFPDIDEEVSALITSAMVNGPSMTPKQRYAYWQKVQNTLQRIKNPQRYGMVTGGGSYGRLPANEQAIVDKKRYDPTYKDPL